jgi:hypothetical protein
MSKANTTFDRINPCINKKYSKLPLSPQNSKINKSYRKTSKYKNVTISKEGV